MQYSVCLAETLLRRYPDPDSYPYQSWSYPQGFLLWGFIRLYEKTGERRYYDYVMRYCEEHVTPDGTVLGFTGISLDGTSALLADLYTNPLVTNVELYTAAEADSGTVTLTITLAVEGGDAS